MGRPMLACPDRRSPKPGCHCAWCGPRATAKAHAYTARLIAAGRTRYPRRSLARWGAPDWLGAAPEAVAVERAATGHWLTQPIIGGNVCPGYVPDHCTWGME